MDESGGADAVFVFVPLFIAVDSFVGGLGGDGLGVGDFDVTSFTEGGLAAGVNVLLTT